MSTHCQRAIVLIIAAVVAVVSASGVTVKPRSAEYAGMAARCCRYEKVLPPKFKNTPDKCTYPAYDPNERHGLGLNTRACKELECILGEKMLNENKSVKEHEIRQLFAEQQDDDVKPVAQAALNECFESYNTYRDTGREDICIIGVQLYNCIYGWLVRNCPSSAWDETRRDCKYPDERD